ncbi:DNA translocase FtsK [Candidatus Cyrtobacter comes]|uniref:DNA translocase FtsK n=1 Tax=Candidatus Cyrtobacter comes TaxID=675776 RepID=A0ABU5L907_9RICK|nr:DNA translocase FtsK [Candidatus Cyrtobacter comes]
MYTKILSFILILCSIIFITGLLILKLGYTNTELTTHYELYNLVFWYFRSCCEFLMLLLGFAAFLPFLSILILSSRKIFSNQKLSLLNIIILNLFVLPIISAAFALIENIAIPDADFTGYGGILGDYVYGELHDSAIPRYIITLGLLFVSFIALFFVISIPIKGYIRFFFLLSYCIGIFIKFSITRLRFIFSKKTRSENNTIEVKKESFKLEHNNKDLYKLPGTNLLKKSDLKNNTNKADPKYAAEKLAVVLSDFGIKGEIVGYKVGPVVTLYSLEPAAGTKASRVMGLCDDIARSMSAFSTRISTIQGKNLLGIELPNDHREMILLRDVLESEEFSSKKATLPLALGKDIAGDIVVADLAKMPHLLVAGTTGSGKSVAINTMIMSILYKHSPDECKLVMIDPKMLELSVYEDIPHLISPVVTDSKKAVIALKWLVKEMEERYRAMSAIGVRNISGYNTKISSSNNLYKKVQVGFEKESGKPLYEKIKIKSNILPHIVVIIDEMADLMVVSGKEVEAQIQRLAQMARAAGIHIIMATQRPSVDVVTGVIKANFPTRISFQVTSKIDSRTILGEQGAEQLLGMGDMLYMSTGGRIERVHGPFIGEDEIERVVEYWKKQGLPQYVDGITEDDEQEVIQSSGGDKDADLYNAALEIVLSEKKASTSYIQRKLRIGYNRAAALIDRMEQEGIVSAANHVGKREILK